MTSVPLSIDTCLQFACDSADKPCSKKTQNTSSSQNVMALLFFSFLISDKITMTLNGPLKTFPSYEIRAATMSAVFVVCTNFGPLPRLLFSINFIHSWKAHLNISLLQGLYLSIKHAASPGVPKLSNATDCKRSTLQMNFSQKMHKWEKLGEELQCVHLCCWQLSMCDFLKIYFVGIWI